MRSQYQGLTPMAIVVVGGCGTKVGKTALVCGILAALPEFTWTAVKITTHHHEVPSLNLPSEPGAPSFPHLFAERMGDRGPQPANALENLVWEEQIAGQGTDTARYLAAGARRALLVRANSRELGQTIQPLLQSLRTQDPAANLIFESNRILEHVVPDLCLAVEGDLAPDPKPSFQLVMRQKNATVRPGARDEVLTGAGPHFRLAALERISPEMLDWLRTRLPRRFSGR